MLRGLTLWLDDDVVVVVVIATVKSEGVIAIGHLFVLGRDLVFGEDLDVGIGTCVPIGEID